MILTLALFVRRHPLQIMLAVVTGAYLICYWLHPVVPGGNTVHPLGWWGWFDQGKYLEGAQALSNFDLRGEKNHYPPLYPALGAIFLPLSGMHPYFIVNLLCFIWIGYVFFKVASTYLPPWIVVCIFMGTLVLDKRFFENFLIPWTTTLGAALLSFGIYLLYSVYNKLKEAPPSLINIPMRKIFLGSFAVGLLALTRPVDLLVGIILIAGAVGLMSWYVLRFHEQPFRSIIRIVCVALAGGIIGPLLFIGFNYVAFGSLLGGYIHASSQNGYYLTDIGEKFVSIFLDGNALYLQSNTSMIWKIPWLIIALIAIPCLFFTGDFLLVVIMIAVCAQYAIYLPYGDLLPNSLWHFLNIHYFKWTMPYLALFACIFLHFIYKQWTNKARFVPILSYALLAILLIALINIHVNYYSFSAVAAASELDSKPISIDLIVKNQLVDIIDVGGLTGSYYDVYFGNHQMWADGRELKHIRDFRAIQADWGIRVVLIRPLVADSIRFVADSHIRSNKPAVLAKVAYYKIGFRSFDQSGAFHLFPSWRRILSPISGNAKNS